MEIKPRSAWNAAPAESVTPWDPKDLDGVCVHWFGSPKAVASPDQVDDQLRAVQKSHQAGEFNDIAYNFSVDPFGQVWELRGWNRQTGANGTTDANRRFMAVVVMIGTGDVPSEKTLAALGAFIREAQHRGVGMQVRPHHDFTGTECPGLKVRAWIAAEGWKLEPPQKRWRWVLKTDDGKIHDQSAPFTTASAVARYMSFSARVAGLYVRLVKERRGPKIRRESVA